MDKNKVWNRSFGEKTEGYDYSGRLVKKSAYNNRSSQYGWNIDHIRPVSNGGKDIICNAIACHIKTNEEKAGRFPHWEANSQKWKAIKVAKHCYKIVSNN